MNVSVHNPDRYISDFRHILSHGIKKIGFLIGAGVPFSIRVNPTTEIADNSGEPLIPNIAGLTEIVLNELEDNEKNVLNGIKEGIGQEANIEHLLSKVRMLSEAIGQHHVDGLDGNGYSNLAQKICEIIGNKVKVNLPEGEESLLKFVAWINGALRTHPLEIFTTNYDLLMEEALEYQSTPYFDGFSGGNKPFFDPSSIAANDLPARWVRLWKIHGSLGWATEDGKVIRQSNRNANELIYPDHLKYNHIQKLPYTSLFERLSDYIHTPDTLLVCCGFSFADAHIAAVIEEALSANPTAAVIALQYGTLEEETVATNLAKKNSNLSVYASDGACIGSTIGKWQTGDPLNDEWEEIRSTFWEHDTDTGNSYFTLGNFQNFSQFISHVNSQKIRMVSNTPVSETVEAEQGSAIPAEQIQS